MAEAPLVRYTREIWGGKSTYRTGVYSVGTSPTLLAGNNPSRMGLYIVNRGAAQLAVWPNPSIVFGEGFVLAASGGWIAFQALEDGELVGVGFYGVASSGTLDVSVLEVLALE